MTSQRAKVIQEKNEVKQPEPVAKKIEYLKIGDIIILQISQKVYLDSK